MKQSKELNTKPRYIELFGDGIPEELRQGYEAMRRPFNYHYGMYEVFDIPIITNTENTDHNTTKPKKLIERLIKNSSNEGDSVIDPCLGSGTTLEVCMNTNRNCLGIEIDPQWEPIYRKRLKLDNTKLDMYNKMPGKNSLVI